MSQKFRIPLICITTILLNFFTASFFYHVLKIPLFFDTIWTVAVIFFLGLFPGLIVAVGYNLLNWGVWIYKNNSGNFVILYTICGVLIVLSTWFFARNKDEFKISPVITVLYLLVIALVSSLCTIIVGGLIDYYQYLNSDISSQMNPIKNFTDSFLHQKYNLLVSCILSQIPISFLDRFIATFAGYGIYKLAQQNLRGVQSE